MNGRSGRTQRIPDFAKARFVRPGARPGGEIVNFSNNPQNCEGLFRFRKTVNYVFL